MVVDDKGKFREDSFQRALNALVPNNEDKDSKENGKLKGLALARVGEESDIFKIVKMIIQRQYDPVILFSFSKRECELLAMQVTTCFVIFLFDGHPLYIVSFLLAYLLKQATECCFCPKLHYIWWN